MGNVNNLKTSAKYEVLALITGSKKESVKKYFNRRNLDLGNTVQVRKFIFKFFIKKLMSKKQSSGADIDDDIDFLDLDNAETLEQVEKRIETEEEREDREENEKQTAEVRKTIATPAISKKRRAFTM